MNGKTRAAIIGLWCAAQVAGAQQLTVEQIANGLERPLQVTFAPGDPDRIFIVEKGGRIQVMRNGQSPEVFLDVSDIVTQDQSEGGLLALAFDPDYQTNGFFYVHYIRAQDGDEDPVIIARFEVSGDPDRADPDSATMLMEVPQLRFVHHGGWLEFGPNDGMLYISLGDGGHSESAQNTSNLLGSILRIDPRSDDFPNDPLKNYAIPDDNPFVDDPDARSEIWAYGFRAPWRAAFDEATGDLYLGDVGAASYEELNFQSGKSKGGENYGWECYEGFHETGRCVDPPASPTPPIFEFTHEDGRNAIIGGRVYRGCAIPELQGSYIFADYGTQTIWSLRYDGAQIIELMDRSDELTSIGGPITSFGRDFYGELYVCKRNGRVFKILPAIPPPDSDGDGIPDSCDECNGTADIDMDGDVDAEDFFAYMDAFAAGNFGICDIDNDGDCDAKDFFGYLDLFVKGC